MSRSTKLCLAAGLALLAAIPLLAQSSGEFTIAALPDTQMYAKSYPQVLNAETKWIADHASQLNIKLVVGLGDIVDSGSDIGQWQTADAAYRQLDGKVPYVAAIGNHDYDMNKVSGRTSSATNFNAFFGPNRYRGQASYKGSYPSGSNENFYSVYTFGGQKYLVLVLECFPRNSVLGWAAAVLRNNPDKQVIVVTHAYTYADNTRMDKCDSNSAASFGVSQDNDGEQVWEKFVSKYPNITMVLSGHVVQGDGTGHRTDIGINGNIVTEMLSDFQSWPSGGNGYIRLITVKPATNQVVVRTYSPYANAWLTDAHNQFTLPYKRYGLTSGTGALYGRVKVTGTCAALPGVQVSNGSGTVTTDANGYYSLPAIGPKSYTLTAKSSGLIAVSQNASVVPGRVSPGKIVMSSKGVISGIVTLHSQPLPGTKVSLNGGALRQSLTVTTASDGSYSFGTVAVGTYKLTVNPTGNSSTTRDAIVSMDTTTFVNLSLP